MFKVNRAVQIVQAVVTTSQTVPIPRVAQEIVEDLDAALEQFREIAVDLGGGHVNPTET